MSVDDEQERCNCALKTFPKAWQEIWCPTHGAKLTPHEKKLVARTLGYPSPAFTLEELQAVGCAVGEARKRIQRPPKGADRRSMKQLADQLDSALAKMYGSFKAWEALPQAEEDE